MHAENYYAKLPKFFLYPFAQTPIFIIVLSTITAYIGINYLSLTPLIITGFFLLSFVLKYCITILEHTSGGFTKPPAISLKFITLDFDKLSKFIALSISYGVLNYLILKFSPNHLSGIYMLMLNAIAPASLIILAIDGNFFSSFNPIQIFQLIYRLGSSYLLILGLLLLMHIGLDYNINLLGNFLPSTVMSLLLFLETSYLLVVIFAVIGFIVHHHHQDLGYKADVAIHSYKVPNQNQSNEFKRVQDLLLGGNHKAAIIAFEQCLKNDPNNIELCDKYFKILLFVKDTEKLFKHCRYYLALLLKHNKGHKATQVYYDCLVEFPDFKLDNDKTCYLLGKALRHFSKPKLAASLLKSFSEEYPGSHYLPDATLTLAKTYADGLHDDNSAKTMLKELISTYPYHQAANRAKDYLAILEAV